MIRTLTISNYALIERLEMEFKSGFITITGETGAGKSILMGALSLILGNRADLSVLLNKEKKCVVEGTFLLNNSYQPFFQENDLDYEAETVIRREILPGGKSRAFINDTPVNLQAMKALGDQLVDIHSQHQSLRLNDHTYQLQVVDHVAGHQEVLDTYGAMYRDFRDLERELEEQKQQLTAISGELDYFQFQYDELNGANLQDGELESLEEELEQLEHAEEIKLALSLADQSLSGEEQVLSRLSEVISSLRKVSGYYKPAAEILERLESGYIELKDLSLETSLHSAKISHDPDALEKARSRVDLLYNLLQKHRKKSLLELVELRDDYGKKIEQITFSDDTLKRLEQQISQALKALSEQASLLDKARRESGKLIQERVVEQLRELGIPSARFTVSVEHTDQPRSDGMNEVRFLFSANRQSPEEEVARVASGGEVSRLMLAIKSLLSDYKGQPTLIFDEIDTGVSGETAEKMGSIMKGMSGDRQVIAITHLPQVASQGGEHFLVYKTDEDGKDTTRIKLLSSEERIVEIAKLLSGEKLTDAALSNARELLNP